MFLIQRKVALEYKHLYLLDSVMISGGGKKVGMGLFVRKKSWKGG